MLLPATLLTMSVSALAHSVEQSGTVSSSSSEYVSRSGNVEALLKQDPRTPGALELTLDRKLAELDSQQLAAEIIAPEYQRLSVRHVDGSYILHDVPADTTVTVGIEIQSSDTFTMLSFDDVWTGERNVAGTGVFRDSPNLIVLLLAGLNLLIGTSVFAGLLYSYHRMKRQHRRTPAQSSA